MATAWQRLTRTTAFRLAVIQLVVFAVLTALLIGTVAVRTNALFTRQVDEAIAEEVTTLVDAYQRGGIRRLAGTVEARARRPGASLYLVADSTGRTLVGNVADVPLAVLSAADGESLLLTYRRLDGEGAQTLRALVRVFELPGGFRLLIGRDLTERDEFRTVIRDAALAALAVMLVTGVASWLLVGRGALKRVEAMAEDARGIMTGDLSRRIAVTGTGDEFDSLAGSLNAMLARIESLMTGLKEVSDNIAHDLKTPLTRLRNRLETALREAEDGEPVRAAVAASIAEADQAIATFDALLRIARVEAGAPGDAVEPVDGAAVVTEIGELYEPVIEEAGGRLAVATTGSAMVRGNRALIAQALSNLVDNALKYAARDEGGGLAVTLSATSGGGEVRLAVRDDGPGIAEEDRARAVERFVRLDASRSRPGSGLGLALVQAVARLHGGRLELEDGAPGLAATLVLPAAPSDTRAGAADSRGTGHG